jgi:arabinogalactan oligomer/maltooligosaccharide transport system permease protein
MNQLVTNQYDQVWGPFTAGALLAAVPVVILFLFLQRWIIGGLTQGAVKG